MTKTEALNSLSYSIGQLRGLCMLSDSSDRTTAEVHNRMSEAVEFLRTELAGTRVPTTEVNVATWIGVIAEMARSRLHTASLGDNPHEAWPEFCSQVEEMMVIARSRASARSALLRIAAFAIRMADGHHPGDGLEF